ncbi:SulP family inorganic anion transporter [Arcobacter sp. FWKO B]|uniref:SulP family inorganic anion transporter n=1 Tax=Arcobacter sp. FWKO B TaxID=2593672 RepID=UPI0018A58073|nr:sulfate permease [Arcobacter sp. FWKO B]QOG11476.1 sulfate permease [Arcobacter sp. FWKO B]
MLTKIFTFLKEFTPESYSVYKQGYKKEYFSGDMFSGITVAIVALPLAMAFAIASGVEPEKGLITAIVAGILISLFGGSRVQIGGPTGAFVVIIYDIVLRHGYEGLAIATMMAGVILIIMGFLRFGAVLKYIPYPVITGFTTGIAVIIFSSTIKDFFGFEIEQLPADFIGKWLEYVSHLGNINYLSVAIAILSILIIIYTKKIYPKIPGPIVAVIIGSIIVYMLGLNVETIESRFGSIPNTLPMPSIPSFTFEQIKELIPAATTIALLAAIESLLCAVVADGMTGQRHKSNTELVGQGIGNIGSILFGGIAATGAIARTATNVKAGAKTPLAGIIHAVFVFLFMFALAGLIVKIPMATLAAILIIVSWNMSELDHFKHILKGPRSDAAVLVVTFLLTVLIDLTVAVQVGVVLAALLFIKRITDVTSIEDNKLKFNEFYANDEDVIDDPDATHKKKIPDGVEVYEINGPFFFGIADRLQNVLDNIEEKPKVFILRMRKVPVIDATAMHALSEFYNNCKKNDTWLILSGVNNNVETTLTKAGFFKHFDQKFVAKNIDEALTITKEVIKSRD